MRRGLGFHARRSPGVFNPGSLFLGGTVNGAWFDPSDSTTLFSDRAGTTPCGTPGGGSVVPVGLMLDKSQGLQRFWSGYFDGTGDYLSTAASAGIAFGTGDFTIECWVNTQTVANATQKGIFQTSDTVGGLKASYTSGVSAGFGGTGNGGLTIFVGGTNYSTAANLVTISAWFHLAVTRAAGVVNVWLNGVSVASGSGNTNNLTGQYAAIGGYYNTTFLMTGNVSNFRIIKGTAIYTGTFTPPSPVTGLTAISGTSLLTCQNSTFIDNSGNNVTITANGDAVTSQNIPLGNHAIAANDTTARPELRAVVNLLNGSATLATQSVTTVATTYTLYFTGSGSITLSGTATGTYAAGSSSVVCTAGTLTLTVSGTVTTADLRPANSGAQLPVYQARTDANTYDAVGFPRYLACNGTSSAMSTPGNVNLSGTDKATVFAGVRRLGNTSSAGIIQELSSDGDSNNGCVLIYAEPTAKYGVNSRGTARALAQTLNAYSPPITNILTGVGEISTDTCILRVNGAQVATSATDQGTGNYGTYPLFIGSRNNSSLFLNGNIYSLIVVGSAVSAGQISATEQWVAQRTGITL